MNSLEITVDDIVDAIGTENIELPSGEIRNEDMYFPVKVKRVYTD
jgi:HAE1 family hydrophobic/amphiphilic exporter-1